MSNHVRETRSDKETSNGNPIPNNSNHGQIHQQDKLSNLARYHMTSESSHFVLHENDSNNVEMQSKDTAMNEIKDPIVKEVHSCEFVNLDLENNFEKVHSVEIEALEDLGQVEMTPSLVDAIVTQQEFEKNTNEIVEAEGASFSLSKWLQHLDLDLEKEFLHYSTIYFEAILNLENTALRWQRMYSPGVCTVNNVTLDDVFCETDQTKEMENMESSLNLLDQEVVITLSESILKHFQKKQILQVLIHEMIHAYLILTKGQFHGNHGMYFQQKMNEINEKEGLAISVFNLCSDFRDTSNEKTIYQWTCNKCFLKVERIEDIAPSPFDLWWKIHSSNCSGTFIKKVLDTSTRSRKYSTSEFLSKEEQVTDCNQEYNPQSPKHEGDAKTTLNVGSSIEDVNTIEQEYESDSPFVVCPLCKRKIQFLNINIHLFFCLRKKKREKLKKLLTDFPSYFNPIQVSEVPSSKQKDRLIHHMIHEAEKEIPRPRKLQRSILHIQSYEGLGKNNEDGVSAMRFNRAMTNELLEHSLMSSDIFLSQRNDPNASVDTAANIVRELYSPEEIEKMFNYRYRQEIHQRESISK